MQPWGGASKPGHAISGRKAVLCNANGGWPWSKRKATPPPPPPPPAQQQIGDAAGDDLLRTSPKWRSWPVKSAPPSPQHTNSVQQQRFPQQLSPEQQAALQDMLIDSTVNPKWRWPSFGNNSSPLPSQQQPQQQWPQQPTRPPPPPPQQRVSGPGWQQQKQQQKQQRRQLSEQQKQQLYTRQQQEFYDAQPPQLPQQQLQQQLQQQWRWPFIGRAFDPTPEDEFRERLEAMGVDLAGKRAREQQQQQQQDVLQSFEQLDDREVARYMNQLRQSRLERVQHRQDDEVVGIAGLYLSITLLILFMAALTNLPT